MLEENFTRWTEAVDTGGYIHLHFHRLKKEVFKNTQFKSSLLHLVY